MSIFHLTRTDLARVSDATLNAVTLFARQTGDEHTLKLARAEYALRMEASPW